jgi:hypothetical protein
MFYMAHWLRAKELHSFVAYSFLVYDYAYDTEVDIWRADRFQDLLVHYMLMSNLNIFRIIRMQ